MLLRNANTGGLEVYDIANNAITNAAFIGTIGLDWRFSGVGNFSGVPGETDLLLRNVNTGGLEVYDINNNQLIGAAFIGTVGLDWQFAGVAPTNGPGTFDLVLRNVNTGQFEVYDIANNQLTGRRLVQRGNELAARRLCRQRSGRVDRRHGQLEPGRPTRAGDGWFYRRRRCGRHPEFRPTRRPHITAAVADDTATRLTTPQATEAALAASSRVLGRGRGGDD